VGARDDGAARSKDARRQRREAQLEARRRLEAAQQRRRMFIWGGGIALAVVALGALIWWLAHPVPGPAVQSFPIQGQVHIQRGQQHPEYNSKPPTSGWHYGDAVAPWGVSSQPIPDEVQVHNLEHGGIAVQYDCPDGCPDVVNKLDTIVRSYPSKVLLAPYAGIGHRIALTAWGKLVYLDDVNEPFIRDFIAKNKNKGPEQVPD
jgi:4-amino-4-deoxy-L-arabinose transferase-like glycosyltransferase